MTDSDRRGRELRRLAAEIFGLPRLRDEQLTAMELVLDGHDVLAVLPTGAGKSAIYQVPALLVDGPTVVVSPLIALQHDQMEGIEDSRAPRAVALNSAQSRGERRDAWDALRRGDAEYVFLSPEQLAKEELVEALAALEVALFVVDEAHCVSAWGHDFRPDYLRLGPMCERLGHPRVIALTATAAPPVRRDIVTRLGMLDHREVIASFDRPNLHLAARRFTSESDKHDAVIAHIRELAGDPRNGCGLLYTASRKDTDRYARELDAAGVRAAGYHAGMKTADRERVHQDFLNGEVDVVVATSAFGMGIDKPDVRFVAHASVPDSLDSYYQQIGRAGRDGDPAETILFYRPEDLNLQRFLTTSKPPTDTVDAVARALARHDHPIPPKQLADEVDAAPARRTRAVNLLEQAGALTTTGSGRLAFDADLTPDDAADLARDAATAHETLITSRLRMLRGYAETTDCRRRYLLGYFGEQLLEPCGNCDTCDAGTASGRARGTDEFPLDSRVRHEQWGCGVVLSAEQDRITVLFDDFGYRTLSLPEVRKRGLLVRAPDPSGGVCPDDADTEVHGADSKSRSR
ncbi:ATP-dependent DNA helicase RecQ [Streptomyces gardneri]|uniref:RecQ family ATP-dependent DNA helicase n=1 Tax=Nocardia sputi TaxID=2943705 RepID=UPI0018940D99|nr:ATP-dependent DNA helicase RecQ [Nocardia sputi]MBF6168001.1 ATP-dependent DNA helicase RecQ [Streptomyces gardneri]